MRTVKTMEYGRFMRDWMWRGPRPERAFCKDACIECGLALRFSAVNLSPEQGKANAYLSECARLHPVAEIDGKVRRYPLDG